RIEPIEREQYHSCALGLLCFRARELFPRPPLVLTPCVSFHSQRNKEHVIPSGASVSERARDLKASRSRAAPGGRHAEACLELHCAVAQCLERCTIRGSTP